MYGKLDDEAIEKVLRSATVGRFGLWDGERSYVFPVTYLYDADERRLLGHTLPGHKLDLLRSASEVHFQVDIAEDPFNWRSVMAWGDYSEIEGDAAVSALQRIADALTTRFANLEPPTDEAIQTVATTAAVYEIAIDEWSGRFERRVDSIVWSFADEEPSPMSGPFHAGRRPSSLEEASEEDE